MEWIFANIVKALHSNDEVVIANELHNLHKILSDKDSKERLNGLSQAAIDAVPESRELLTDLFKTIQQHKLDDASALALYLHRLQGLSFPPPIDYDFEAQRHLAASFSKTYQGKAYQNFHNFVSELQLANNANDKCYGLTLPIVQSSGTGKTRMVIQLGKKAPVLYVCLRPSSTTSAKQGFPLGDNIIASYFEDAERLITDQVVAAFVGAWFHITAEKLKNRSSGSMQQTLQSWNTFPCKGHSPTRQQLFQDISDMACSLLLESGLSKDSHVPGTERLEEWYSMIGSTLIAPYAKSFASVYTEAQASLQYPSSGTKPIIYFAVDECVQLFTWSASCKEGRDYLSALRRAWNYVGELKLPVDLWLLLLSTSSGAAKLALPTVNMPSLRQRFSRQMPVFVNTG